MKTLVRYRPRTLGMLEDFDRMFDSVFNLRGNGTTDRPAVDIQELEDRYVLEAELPGHGEDDVDVKLDDNLLTVSAKRDDATEEKREGYILKERRMRSFTRSFVLPKDVDRERIEARFNNGLLTLDLYKSPEAKPRQIEVKNGNKAN